MASSGNTFSAVKGGSGAESTPANNIGGERKSSTSSIGSSGGGLFNGLMNQKRNSLDETARARRESHHDMKPQPGVIGKMWHNFTMGAQGTK